MESSHQGPEDGSDVYISSEYTVPSTPLRPISTSPLTQVSSCYLEKEEQDVLKWARVQELGEFRILTLHRCVWCRFSRMEEPQVQAVLDG